MIEPSNFDTKTPEEMAPQTQVQPAKVEEFKTILNSISFAKISKENLKKLSVDSCKYGKEAIILFLDSVISNNLSLEKYKEIDIGQIHTNLVGWALTKKDEELLKYLVNPYRKEQLNMDNPETQIQHLFFRCLDNYLFDAAAYVITVNMDKIQKIKIDIKKLIKALLAADNDYFYNNKNRYPSSKKFNKPFDTILSALLKNKKINLENFLYYPIEYRSKTYPFAFFILRAKLMQTFTYLVSDNKFDPNLLWENAKETLVEYTAFYGSKELLADMLAKGGIIKLEFYRNFKIIDSENHFKQERLFRRKPGALHLAAASGSEEKVEFLLQQGADLNCKNEFDLTPLHSALDMNNAEMVKFLESKGAAVVAFDSNTLKWWAHEHKNPVAIKYYLEHHPHNTLTWESDYQNMHLVHYLARGNDLENLQFLIAQFKKYYKNLANYLDQTCHFGAALHIAAGRGHTDIIKELLENGANPNVKTSKLATALHYAVSSDLISEKKIAVVESLISHGIDVNAENQSGYKAVDCAKDEVKKYLENYLHNQLVQNAKPGAAVNKSLVNQVSDNLRKIFQSVASEDQTETEEKQINKSL